MISGCLLSTSFKTNVVKSIVMTIKTHTINKNDIILTSVNHIQQVNNIGEKKHIEYDAKDTNDIGKAFSWIPIQHNIYKNYKTKNKSDTRKDVKHLQHFPSPLLFDEKTLPNFKIYVKPICTRRYE